MKNLPQIIRESILQALQQLRGNKLRSFLSLLGVTIGIFCIIGVQSAVDSLEDNVRGSFDKLGDDVIYVQKFSWAEDPGRNFWKFMRRPNISYEDYRAAARKVRSAELLSYHVMVGMRTAKYLSNSAENVFLLGVTYDFGRMFSMEFEKGRYFSPSEYQYGANKVVLGANVAAQLFGQIEPVGKNIKVGGRKMEVIGVLEKSGESLVNVMNFDDGMLISYEFARKIANLKSADLFGNSSLNVKAGGAENVQRVRDDLTGALRAHRRLKPKEENNFALNELSILSSLLSNFFTVLNVLGLIVGGFAIFVGMFSVANIMFVSVKERTAIIGIKKALGAKRYVILLEFLIESVILCLAGGAIGLLLVQAGVAIISSLINFHLFMSLNNIVLGVASSVLVGVIAGLIPAMQAASMDPVVAMRK
jgi:putative ABC transport system permease protein